VKNYSHNWFLFALFLFLITSCSDSETTATEPIAKTDTKKTVKAKKKEKKKKLVPKKQPTTMAAAGPAKAEEKEAEEITTDNKSMMMVLANNVNVFAVANGYSTKYCFLVDMSLPSGRNRFFVYDLEKGVVIKSALVAHGSCNETFLARPRYSNSGKSGCSSLGKYSVGEFYRGKYGKSFRLHGLDNSNSNAFSRAVVIHGYNCVPDEEIYPRVLCNSLGCVMVSYNFFDKISNYIQKTDKPIVLWVYG
jgi:hypothetical protein